MNAPTLPKGNRATSTTTQDAKPADHMVVYWSSVISLSLVIGALAVALNGRFGLLPLLPPNEVGDFLAGFAGALAFVWIIAAILLQRKELELQREELILNRKETQRLADEAQKQAFALRASARTYFIQRWENALRLIGDIRLANAAEEFLDGIYNSGRTNALAEKRLQQIQPDRTITNIRLDRRDITRLYLDERDIIAQLSCDITASFDGSREGRGFSLEVRIPYTEISALEFTSRHKVSLLNFYSAVSEGCDIGLQGMMRDYDVSVVIYPDDTNSKRMRCVRSFVAVLVDELIKKREQERMTPLE